MTPARRSGVRSGAGGEVALARAGHRVGSEHSLIRQRSHRRAREEPPNGDVGGFRQVRRAMLASVCDEAFDDVYGSTDGEQLFALVIDEMLRANARPIAHGLQRVRPARLPRGGRR